MDAGANGMRPGLGPSSGKGGAPFTLPSNNIVVAPNGLDTNPGTWERPVKTWMQGLILLNASGGGRLLIAGNCWASPNDGQGLLVRGTFDTGGGGEGWVTMTTSIQILPVKVGPTSPQSAPFTQLLPGGGAPNFTGATSPLEIAGFTDGFWMQQVGILSGGAGTPCIRIGFSSPLAAWSAVTTYDAGAQVISGGVAWDSMINGNLNNPPASSPSAWLQVLPTDVAGTGLGISETALMRFESCALRRDGDQVGPCVDHGTAYEEQWSQTSVYRFGITTINQELTNCAMRYVCPNIRAQYLQTIEHCFYGGGGLYVRGNSTINKISHVLLENGMMAVVTAADDPFSGAAPVTVYGEWLTNADAEPAWGKQLAINNLSTAIEIQCKQSDPSAGGVVEVDPLDFQLQARGVCGVEQYLDTRQHDTGRRGYGPSSTDLPNIAWQPTGAPAQGPSGLMDAIVPPVGTYFIFQDGSDALQTMNDGDRLVWNIRMMNTPTSAFTALLIVNVGADPITFYLGGPGQNANRQYTLAPNATLEWFHPRDYDSYLWLYTWGWLKMVDRGSGGLQIKAGVTNARLWGAFAQILPAATSSDGEAFLRGLHGESSAGINVGGHPIPPPVGAIALRPGERLAFWDATGSVWKQVYIDAGAWVIV